MRELMKRCLRGALSLSLVAGLGLCTTAATMIGCRGDGSNNDTPMDLSVPTMDLAKPLTATTIRQLNTPGGSVKVRDKVKFTGVVVSPLMYASYDDNTTGDDYCNFRIAVMQADGSQATLQDGMSVNIDLRVMFAADMGGKLSFCQDEGKKNAVVVAMDALKLGDLVEIQGFFDSFGANGSRYIDAFGGRVTGMGPSPMMPMPVPVADPTMFAGASPLPKAFVDASGVLVKFSNVQVTKRDAAFPNDWVVNTSATGGANIGSNYLRILIPNYMAPMVNDMYMSVTGIVFGDFGGKIWVRNMGDLQM